MYKRGGLNSPREVEAYVGTNTKGGWYECDSDLCEEWAFVDVPQDLDWILDCALNWAGKDRQHFIQ